MRKIVCPSCEYTKRPYGFPRDRGKRRPGSHQDDYKIGTFEYICDKCGTAMFVKMDYVIELSPVDIKEVWTADGIAAEILDEKRGARRERTELREVGEDEVTRPPKE
jgi:hypothetical protein